MNKAFFVGRVGKDAEVKYTPQGKAVCNFSIAVDVGWGENKKTLWVGGTLWEKKAESLAKFLTKGKQVAICGEVDLRVWIGRNDGDAQGQITVNVRDLTLCGGSGDRQSSDAAQPNPEPSDPRAGSPITDEDIPF